ncbi:hypothetical protein CONPUDRAFT_25708, partial [Coniophora puteana RWD-64-598 SS2]
LRIHHGPLDQTTITTRPPPEVMARVCAVLDELGIEFKAESEFKYRCVRAKRRRAGGGVNANGVKEPVYGDQQQDAGDEVRFSVELTRIDRLKDTYSIDIRRLKGNLRSYKFLYDTLRE